MERREREWEREWERVWRWEPERERIVGTAAGFGVGTDTSGTTDSLFMGGEPDRSNTNSQDHSQRRCQQTSLANPIPSLLLFVHLFLFLFLAQPLPLCPKLELGSERS